MKRLTIYLLVFFSLMFFDKIVPAVEESTSDYEEVIAEGMGLSEEEAQLAAIREGVRKVVGELVNAETIVKNQKIVEKIMLLSRGAVEKHEVLSSSKDAEEIWTVTMKVQVKRTALAARLKSGGVQTNEFDGSQVAMQLAFKKGQDKDNIQFLAKYFQDSKFPYSLIDIVQEEVQTIDKRDESSSSAAMSETSDGVTLVLPYKVKPNMEKYNQFRDGLNEILDKVAVTRYPFPITFIPAREKLEQRGDWKTDIYIKLCSNIMEGQGNYFNTISLPDRKEDFLLLVFQSQTGGLKNTSWNAYVLPAVFKEFFVKYSCVIPVANVSLYGKNNDLLISKYVPIEMPGYSVCPDHFWPNTSRAEEWYKATAVGIYNFCPYLIYDRRAAYTQSLDGSVLTEYEHDYYHKYNQQPQILFIGPMVSLKADGANDFYYIFPTLNLQTTFELTIEELKEIKKTGFEIIFHNPGMERYYKQLKMEKGDNSPETP